MSDSIEPALNRRELLHLGAASALANAFPAHPTAAGQPEASKAGSLHTPLCDLLGIRYPVLQAPMARVVTPEMIAAVARAGGFGFLPGAGVPPDQLRQQIRRIKALTDLPFGVNLILHPALRAPIQPDQIPAATMAGIQATLNRFRTRLGLPPGADRAPALPAIVDEAFSAIADERVPVFSASLGRPTPEMFARCRAQGMKVMAMAATFPDALEVAALGVDAIIAQGGEAGGHRSTWIKRASPDRAAIGTMALVPQVASAVGVPVVAAGGIVNGRQLVASLALGAAGVLLGTRFIATTESAAPPFYKQALVSGDGDDTTITDAFTGLYARVVRNTFTEEYRASGAPVVPVVQQVISSDVTEASANQGTGEFYPMYAGQAIGMIHDVSGAAAVIRAVVAEAQQALAEVAARVR